MANLPLVVIIVAGALILAIIYIIVVRYVIRKAVNEYVIPLLESKDLSFTGYRWTGFLNSGDFENEVIKIKPAMTGGAAFSSIYVYIFYENNKIKRRVTIKIDSLLWFIKSVVYSKTI